MELSEQPTPEEMSLYVQHKVGEMLRDGTLEQLWGRERLNRILTALWFEKYCPDSGFFRPR